MPLSGNVGLLATRIGNYLRDSVVPRLLPAGGTTGQVLAKSSATNYAVGWTTPAGGGAGPWTVVEKLADQSRSASVALATDSELKFAMAANTKYKFRAVIFFDTTANADFKWRHIGPASPALVRIRRRWILPAGTAYAGIAVDAAYSAADLALAGTGTNGGVIEIDGIIHNGANAGDFGFQWAQNTSDAGSTIVRAGSVLEHLTV